VEKIRLRTPLIQTPITFPLLWSIGADPDLENMDPPTFDSANNRSKKSDSDQRWSI